MSFLKNCFLHPPSFPFIVSILTLSCQHRAGGNVNAYIALAECLSPIKEYVIWVAAEASFRMCWLTTAQISAGVIGDREGCSKRQVDAGHIIAIAGQHHQPAGQQKRPRCPTSCQKRIFQHMMGCQRHRASVTNNAEHAAEINRTSSNMQSVLQLVFSTSMLTIWISSNGLSLRSVLAFSIVITTSLPLVTYKQRNTYIVPIHVLNNRYLQRMMCNIPYTSRTCQGQHNSSKRVKEGSDL